MIWDQGYQMFLSALAFAGFYRIVIGMARGLFTG